MARSCANLCGEEGLSRARLRRQDDQLVLAKSPSPLIEFIEVRIDFEASALFGARKCFDRGIVIGRAVIFGALISRLDDSRIWR